MVAARGRGGINLDKLGVLIAALALFAAFAAPLVTFRANRIVAGEGRRLLEALPPATQPLLLAVVVAASLLALSSCAPASVWSPARRPS